MGACQPKIWQRHAAFMVTALPLQRLMQRAVTRNVMGLLTVKAALCKFQAHRLRWYWWCGEGLGKTDIQHQCWKLSTVRSWTVLHF